jgi:lipopolysaccharide export system protein LptC
MAQKIYWALVILNLIVISVLIALFWQEQKTFNQWFVSNAEIDYVED